MLDMSICWAGKQSDCPSTHASASHTLTPKAPPALARVELQSKASPLLPTSGPVCSMLREHQACQTQTSHKLCAVQDIKHAIKVLSCGCSHLCTQNILQSASFSAYLPHRQRTKRQADFHHLPRLLLPREWASNKHGVGVASHYSFTCMMEMASCSIMCLSARRTYTAQFQMTGRAGLAREAGTPAQDSQVYGPQRHAWKQPRLFCNLEASAGWTACSPCTASPASSSACTLKLSTISPCHTSSLTAVQLRTVSCQHHPEAPWLTWKQPRPCQTHGHSCHRTPRSQQGARSHCQAHR